MRSVIGTVAILGCQEAREPISEYLPTATTASGFREVELGMSFGALRRARPRVMPRPYVGASEGIGADTIFYHFDKPQAHEGKPFKAARRLGRLVGVSEKTSYASSAWLHRTGENSLAS